jgi:hypothetical protein
MKRILLMGVAVLLTAVMGGFSHTVYAAPQYALYIPNFDDPAVKSKFERIGKEDDHDAGKDLLTEASILIKEGPAGEDVVLPYDSGITNGFGDADKEFFYAKPYYCQGGVKSWTKPNNNNPYFRLVYTAGIRADKLEDGDYFNMGFSKAYKVTPSTSGTSSDENEVWSRQESGHGPTDLNFDLGGLRGAVGNDCVTDALVNKGTLVLFPTATDAQRSPFNDLADEADSGSDGVTGSGSGTSTTGTNCQGGPMGWLLCPFVNAMAKTVQTTAGLIERLMEVRFLSATQSGNEVEKAWRAILSLANLLLVIAFLYIIISQATSMGLSNYNVKRMLPRLVVAAILMNLSFYICAFAIDMSNIIGGSVMGFLLGDGNTIGTSITNATGGDGDFISGAIAGVALIALAFFIFIPVVLSIVVVFIVLIARQVILMVLVLLSPLAFVAWLLPNTEKHFKKWSELFTQMLVLYPMVMFMFGASLYLANLIGNPDVAGGILGG